MSTTSTPDEGRFPLGTVLAQRYRIAGRLGKGGMGEVHKEVTMLVVGTAFSLFIAAAAWVLYLALEPFARRRWPQILICWTRVLAGHFRDPQVGAGQPRLT